MRTSSLAFTLALAAAAPAIAFDPADIPGPCWGIWNGRIINLGVLCGDAPIRITPVATSVPAAEAGVEVTEERFRDGRLVGTITNRSDRTAEFIRVYYEVRDRRGELLDASYVVGEPSTLAPGESATFRHTVLEADAYSADAIRTSWQWAD